MSLSIREDSGIVSFTGATSSTTTMSSCTAGDGVVVMFAGRYGTTLSVTVDSGDTVTTARTQGNSNYDSGIWHFDVGSTGSIDVTVQGTSSITAGRYRIIVGDNTDTASGALAVNSKYTFGTSSQSNDISYQGTGTEHWFAFVWKTASTPNKDSAWTATSTSQWSGGYRNVSSTLTDGYNTPTTGGSNRGHLSCIASYAEAAGGPNRRIGRDGSAGMVANSGGIQE